MKLHEQYKNNFDHWLLISSQRAFARNVDVLLVFFRQLHLHQLKFCKVNKNLLETLQCTARRVGGLCLRRLHGEAKHASNKTKRTTRNQDLGNITKQ
jgi:hypothetical protein